MPRRMRASLLQLLRERERLHRRVQVSPAYPAFERRRAGLVESHAGICRGLVMRGYAWPRKSRLLPIAERVRQLTAHEPLR